MALIQTIVTRNEADLALVNIQFHLESGVDHIVLTDHQSTDGLRDHLSPFIDQGVLTYLRQETPGFYQSKWVSDMADMARIDLGARWVINTDSDEFWVAKNGKPLKSAFKMRPFTNVLRAKRHDFICPEQNHPSFWETMIYRKVKSTNSLGDALPDKIAHRCAPNLTIHAGNHDISGYPIKRPRSGLLEVLHFPIRSEAQFKQRIIQGTQSLTQAPDIKLGIGQTWRQQYTELNKTGKLNYITENILTADQIRTGLADGSLVKDTRLRDKMVSLSPEQNALARIQPSE